MKMTQVMVLIGVIVIVFIGLYYIPKLSYLGTEVRLRNAITAQQKSNEAYYDKLWKVIAQKAQVAEQYKSAFKEIYPALIEGRYGNEKGGTLMKFIQESNPNFDIGLYKELSVSIESERSGFFREQQKLIDLKREHDNLIDQPISGFFLSGKAKIDITVVTSTKTAQTFATGKEDDIQLFDKKAEK